jgi:hypothetical protein
LAVEQTARRREFPDERFEVVSRETARFALLMLAGVVLLVVVFRVWLATRIVTPWILTDELIYAEVARNVAEHGSFGVRGDPYVWYNYGYAALISPAWLFADAQSTAFTLAKTINVGLGLLALVPIYLWTRRLTSRGYALLAVALTALMPSLLYAGTLMSENGFLPAFLLAALAIGLTLERPTPWRQALTFAAIGLATLIRVQGIILIAVLPTAVLLASVFEARVAPAGRRLSDAGRYVMRFWPSAAALVLLGLGYVGIKAAQGESLSTGLGSYRIVAETDYVLSDAARWLARHLADVFLATGVFPASALIVLVGLALLRGTPSAAERAFLATAVAAIGWIVPQAALFSTNFSFRIEERYMFCVFPLLFVALAVWLHRGLPRRPWPLAVLAGAAPALAILLALPLRSLLGIQILSDTFALIPLLRLSQLLSGGTDAVELVLGLAVVAAALAFVFIPRRFAAVFPLAVAGFFVLSTYAVHGAMREYAKDLSVATHGGDRYWIDRALGPSQRVDYFYGGGANLWYEANALWQFSLWNRSLDDIYNIGVHDQAGIVEVKASIDPATGGFALLPQDVPPGDYGVAAERLGVSGRILARNGELALYRLEQPARVRRRIEGVYGDGWMSHEAALTQYTTPGRRPAQLLVTVSRAAWGGPDVPGRVVLRLGTVAKQAVGVDIGKVLASRSWVAHSGKTHVFKLRTPAPPFRVELEVSPTFSPSDFGQKDTRQLGVTVGFELVGSKSRR